MNEKEKINSYLEQFDLKNAFKVYLKNGYDFSKSVFDNILDFEEEYGTIIDESEWTMVDNLVTKHRRN